MVSRTPAEKLGVPRTGTSFVGTTTVYRRRFLSLAMSSGPMNGSASISSRSSTLRSSGPSVMNVMEADGKSSRTKVSVIPPSTATTAEAKALVRYAIGGAANRRL
jgi:hypothetical protein